MEEMRTASPPAPSVFLSLSSSDLCISNDWQGEIKSRDKAEYCITDPCLQHCMEVEHMKKRNWKKNENTNYSNFVNFILVLLAQEMGKKIHSTLKSYAMTNENPV